MNSFRANRDLPEGRYKLCEVFSGLEDVKPLKKCIGNSGLFEKILEETHVTLTPRTRYMYVDDEDGSLVVGLGYLRTGNVRYLYLDVIHELVHVKQYLQGKELFDETYSYVERPTEIEAYQCAVEEGRKMRMSDGWLAEYLYVEWITRKDHQLLLEKLGVESNRRRTTRDASN